MYERQRACGNSCQTKKLQCCDSTCWRSGYNPNNQLSNRKAKKRSDFSDAGVSRETMPSPHTQPHICHASARAIDRSRAFWGRPFGAQHRALQSKCRQTYDYTCVRRSWVNTNKGEPNTNKLFQPAQSAFFILNFLHNTQHSFLSIAA